MQNLPLPGLKARLRLIIRVLQKETTDLDSSGPCTTSRSIWKHLCCPTWCPVWARWCPVGFVLLGKCPIVHMVYPASSSGQWFCNMLTLAIAYCIYLSKFLVNSRKQELFTVWVVDQFTLGHGLQGSSIIPSTWTALAETHLHSSQRHSRLDRASHTILATSESDTEAASKLEIKSDACFFCPLKVWMKSGAVHSSAVQQSFTGNSYSPVSMLSHQSPLLTFVPLPSAIIERHDVYF